MAADPTPNAAQDRHDPVTGHYLREDRGFALIRVGSGAKLIHCNRSTDVLVRALLRPDELGFVGPDHARGYLVEELAKHGIEVTYAR